jgi:hypothetical protein
MRWMSEESPIHIIILISNSSPWVSEIVWAKRIPDLKDV